MHIFVFLFLTVFSSSAFAAELPTYDIKAYCKEVAAMSGGSNMIELGCRDMENESKSKLAKMDIPTQTIRYCTEIADFSGGSYSLLEGCIQMEMDAAKKLQ